MPNKNTRTPVFYEPGYVRLSESRPVCSDVDISNPQSIYNYLLSNVYSQDEYCRDAAMILFQHARGRTSCNFVAGPAGCGKTYVWECIKKIWPRTLILNASTITQSGFKGESKAHSFLEMILPDQQDYIVVYDEFDKLVSPRHTSDGDCISAQIQSEFLKMIEGETVRVRKDKGYVNFDTHHMTFVFCGSFAEKARKIAEDDRPSHFGFFSETREDPRPFSRELTMNDLIEFGLIPEIASRATRLTNTHPLTLEDYEYLIKDHPGSPVRKLSEKYHMEIRLSEESMHEIASEAFDSGLGVRNVTAQIQKMIDKRLFEIYKNSSTDPEYLDL